MNKNSSNNNNTDNDFIDTDLSTSTPSGASTLMHDDVISCNSNNTF